jgi:hypothetical protein
MTFALCEAKEPVAGIKDCTAVCDQIQKGGHNQDRRSADQSPANTKSWR